MDKIEENWEEFKRLHTLKHIKEIFNRNLWNKFVFLSILGVTMGCVYLIFNELAKSIVDKVLNDKVLQSIHIIITVIIMGNVLLNKKFKKIINFCNEITFYLFTFSIITFFIVGFGWANTLSSFLCILLIIYTNVLMKNIETNEKLGKPTFKIYDSRKNKLKYLQKLTTENQTNMILIDGKWGIGKTYFIDTFLEQSNENKEDDKYHETEQSHRINIDVLLFNDRNHLISHTLKEIKNILIKEGVHSTASNQFKNIIRIIAESKKLKFTGILDEVSLDKVEKELAEDIKQVKKKIYIIVDNIERIDGNEKIIDILGFLHKIYELLNSCSNKEKNKLNIIVLADSSKFDTEKFTHNYLTKFFINKIILKEIPKVEILDSFKEKINPQVREYIKEVMEEFDDKTRYTYSLKNTNEFQKRVSELNIQLNEQLENPRNIEHFLSSLKRYQEEYQNYYETYCDEKDYIKILTMVSFYRLFLEESFSQDISNIDYKNMREGLSERDKNQEDSLFRYYITFIFFFNVNEPEVNKSVKHELKARNIERILQDKGKAYEDEVIKVESLSKNSAMSEKIIENIIYYIEYMNENQKDFYIQYGIFLDLLKDNKNILTSETISMILSNISFLSFDRKYEDKYNRSIFNYIENDTNIDKNELWPLLVIYMDDFYFYAKEELGFKENWIYLNSVQFFKDFIELYEGKTITWFEGKNGHIDNIVDRIIPIIQEITEDESQEKYFPKEELKKLKNKISIANEIKKDNKNNDNSFFKLIRIYNKLDKAKKNKINLHRQINFSNKLKSRIEKDLESLFLVSDLNSHIEKYIKEIPKDFYKLIARIIGDKSSQNKISNWSYSVISSLIPKEILGKFIKEIEKLNKESQKLIELDEEKELIDKEISEKKDNLENIRNDLEIIKGNIKSLRDISEVDIILNVLKNREPKQTNSVGMNAFARDKDDEIKQFENEKIQIQKAVENVSILELNKIKEKEILKDLENNSNEINNKIIEIQGNINKELSKITYYFNINLYEISEEFQVCALKSVYEKIVIDNPKLNKRFEGNLFERMKQKRDAI